MNERRDQRPAATPEMVKHLAAASDLRLTDERAGLLTPELQGLLDRVRAFYAIDVREAQPSPPFKDEVWE
jgi:hypothetical protein